MGVESNAQHWNVTDGWRAEIESAEVARWVALEAGDAARLHAPLRATGGPHLRLRCSIRLIAIPAARVLVGWETARGFQSVMLSPVLDRHWHDVELNSAGLEFGIQNDYSQFVPPEVTAVRVQVYGAIDAGSTIEISRLSLEPVTEDDVTGRLTLPRGPVRIPDVADWYPTIAGQAPDEVFARCLEKFDIVQPGERSLGIADDLLRDGVYRLREADPLGGVPLRWAGRAMATQQTVARLRWQSLDICLPLCAAYDATGDVRYVATALDHAVRWIDHNLYGQPEDPYYSYYDHGTAMRAIALVAVWNAGVHARLAALDIAQVAEGLHRHGELLASETFLGYNQLVVRYHNHAWYQALALVLISQARPGFRESAQWAELGGLRLVDQSEGLLSAEGFSMENSTGYHGSMSVLMGHAADMADEYGLGFAGSLRAVQRRMTGALRTISFPGLMTTAFGDSWHMLPAQAAEFRREFAAPPSGEQPDAWDDAVLSDTGIAVLRAQRPDGRLEQALITVTSLSQTHKHSDHLSASVWSEGIEWLADPGRYRYGIDDSHGRYYRTARAHTAPTIDSADYVPSPGTGRIVAASTGHGPVSWVMAEHTAYGPTVRRRMVFDKELGILFLLDDVEQGPLVQWFHSGLLVDVAEVAVGILQLRTDEARPSSTWLVALEPARPKISLYHASTDPQAGWIYTKFGPEPTWSWSLTSSSPTASVALLLRHSGTIDDGEALRRRLLDRLHALDAQAGAAAVRG